MAYNYDDLLEPQNSGSGVADQFLFAPISAFAASGIKGPTLTASPGTPVPGEETTITDAHTFVTGEGFIRVLCSPFKNNLTAAAIGETGSMKLNPKLEVVVPGSYAVQHEFFKNGMNIPGIILIKDSLCEANMYYQIGTSCVYGWMTAVEFTTGSNKDGQKAYKVTFESTAAGIYIYKGTVTFKP